MFPLFWAIIRLIPKCFIIKFMKSTFSLYYVVSFWPIVYLFLICLPFVTFLVNIYLNYESQYLQKIHFNINFSIKMS